VIQTERWVPEQTVEFGMIEPLSKTRAAVDFISRGPSLNGYVPQVGDEFKKLTNGYSVRTNPKAFIEQCFFSVHADSATVPPNSSAPPCQVKDIGPPGGIQTACIERSTYPRCGTVVNITPFQPEWQGFLTLEMLDAVPLSAKVCANGGQRQVVFIRPGRPCETSYADRKGKHQRIKEL